MKCSRPRIVYDGQFKSEYPCGKCAACRRSRTREWANRVMHELYYWEKSCFVTLTYSDENVPFSLSKRELQLFIKRLRKSIEPNIIKYFGCGEYGEKHGRPHYHLIIFGLDVKSDCFKYMRRVNNKNYYSVDAWEYGYIDIGNVNYKSAAYVAGYIQKKLGVASYPGREPPFQIQSQGLGARYALENAEKLSKDLHFTMNGAKCSLPRYYRKKLGDKISQTDLNDLIESRVTELDEFLEKSGYDPVDDRMEYKANIRRLTEAEIKALDDRKKGRSF